MSDDEIEGTLRPIYRFEWENGVTVKTDEMDVTPTREQLEFLACLGREDEECEVTTVGYSN